MNKYIKIKKDTFKDFKFEIKTKPQEYIIVKCNCGASGCTGEKIIEGFNPDNK